MILPTGTTVAVADGETIRHGSANPDGRRLVEDNFAAATAVFLNKLSLDGTIKHLVVASDPGTLGEMRKHFHRDLRGKIIGEFATDFSGSARRHRLTGRRRLTRLWKRLPAQARPVITCADNPKLPTNYCSRPT